MLFARLRKSIAPPVSLAPIVVATLSAGVASALLVQPITQVVWSDLPAPIQQRLEHSGLERDAFPAWTAALRERHAMRVREGDEDHLVFYALQSTRFTTAAAIEPAVSARALLARLDAGEHERFLTDPTTLPPRRIPPDARERLRALVEAVQSNAGRSSPAAANLADDSRLPYVRALLLEGATPAASRDATRDAAETRMVRAYARAMRFLVEQELAGRAPDAASAVATLYRTRGLSTDSSLEAGFLVREGLATLRSLDPQRRVRRVTIIGPGFDLAARTGYRDSLPAQSLQPFAVIDALVSLGLSDLTTLRVACLDINPRVVEALTRMKRLGALLTIGTSLLDLPHVAVSDDFRAYVDTLGIAVEVDGPRIAHAPPYRRVAVAPAAVAALAPQALDVVLDRPAIETDLVVVTNVLSYFDDRELALALTNIAAMLPPGGVLLHNEARPEVGVITASIGLPLAQSRTAVLATVKSGAPLYDSVFVHQKR